MSIDERLFGWFSRKLSARRDRVDLARAASSEPHLARLGTLASAIAGVEVEARLVDASTGGVVGHSVLFPRVLAIADSPEHNEQLLLVFATFAGWSIRARRWSEPDEAVAALRQLVEVRGLEAALAAELPRWAELRAGLVPQLRTAHALRGRAAALQALAQARLDGDPGLATLAPPVAAFVARAIAADGLDPQLHAAFDALGGPTRFDVPACWGRVYAATEHDVALAGPGALPSGVTSEREGRQRAPAKRRRALDAPERAENPLTHSFEKVHTAEEYRGGQKRADAGDELDDHAAALDEVALDETVLSSETTRSVYQAGASTLDVVDASPRSTQGLRYDEWDARRRQYLAGYCRVTVVSGPPVLAAGRALAARVEVEQRRAIEQARAAVLRVESALRWKTRQKDGPEIDVDAATERLTALRAGHEGTQRVYLSRRKSARELAVMVLLDASLSTDAWVDDQRVLDLERDAAVIVGQAMDGLVDELAFAAFSSDTHEDCRFETLKRFDEPWAHGLARLAQLTPAGYTRIGPAIRHASTELARCRAHKRVLLMLTDGKPSDRDRYEGRHGESDVRQAIREAGQEHIEVLALGADPRARAAITSMFGRGSVAGLRRPADVALAVADACSRRIRG